VIEINKELILSQLHRSREALDTAIAYVEGGAPHAAGPVLARTIRVGEGRAVAILTSIRDAGGSMDQRSFEATCLRHCRTLVGAGGFLARGSIVREEDKSGKVLYRLSEKGVATVGKWEERYGSNWVESLEGADILGNFNVLDHQKTRLLAQS
jgi:hypothetical protein